MSRERFESVVLPGHKGAAVEVPFDPAQKWSIPARKLWLGRRGHPVHGTLNGVRFESCIVPRSKRSWLLVGEDLLKSARAAEGDLVRVAIEPVTRDAAQKGSRSPGGAKSKRARAPAPQSATATPRRSRASRSKRSR